MPRIRPQSRRTRFARDLRTVQIFRPLTEETAGSLLPRMRRLLPDPPAAEAFDAAVQDRAQQIAADRGLADQLAVSIALRTPATEEDDMERARR
jgi:hypothetical protein